MDPMMQKVVAHWDALEASSNTSSVAVDWQRLDEVMEEHTPDVLAAQSALPPIPGVDSENPRIAASYILVGSVFNFHFKTPGQPPYRVANPDNLDKPFEGFLAFWHKLYQRFGEMVITVSMLWPHVETTETMKKFFGDITEIPLPEYRQQCGMDFALGLERYFGGDPRNILLESTFYVFNEGHGLVEILAERFPVAYGGDCRVFRGRTYSFLKRARLAAMLLHGKKVWQLADINELGPPVDYQLPRILHSPKFRVLLYSPALECAIEEGVEIPRGSEEEVMIRAGTAAICARWMEAKQVPGYLLDAYLFANSRGLPNKAHYTKTSDY